MSEQKQILKRNGFHAESVFFTKVNRAISGDFNVNVLTYKPELLLINRMQSNSPIAYCDTRKKEIVLNYPKIFVNENDVEDMMSVKGFNYHELAHLLYTKVGNDFICREANRLFGYNPSGLSSSENRVKRIYENGSLDFYRLRDLSLEMFNAIEDGRIETLFGLDYPKAGDYFEFNVNNVLMKVVKEQIGNKGISNLNFCLLYARKNFIKNKDLMFKLEDDLKKSYTNEGQEKVERIKELIDLILVSADRKQIVLSLFEIILTLPSEQLNGKRNLKNDLAKTSSEDSLITTPNREFSKEQQNKISEKKEELQQSKKDYEEEKKEKEEGQGQGQGEESEEDNEEGEGEGQGQGDKQNKVTQTDTDKHDSQSEQNKDSSSVGSGNKNDDNFVEKALKDLKETNEGIKKSLESDVIKDIQDLKDKRELYESLNIDKKEIYEGDKFQPTNELISESQKISRFLRELNSDLKSSIKRNKKKGQLDIKSVMRNQKNGTANIFKKMIKNKLKYSNMAVSILVDSSGSVGDWNFKKQMMSCWMLVNALERTNNKVMVIEFNHKIKVKKHFGSKKANYNRSSQGGTEISKPLEYTAREFKRQKTLGVKNFMTIILTDGDFMDREKGENILKQMKKDFNNNSLLIAYNTYLNEGEKRGCDEAKRLSDIDEVSGVMKKYIKKIKVKINRRLQEGGQ